MQNNLEIEKTKRGKILLTLQNDKNKISDEFFLYNEKIQI